MARLRDREKAIVLRKQGESYSQIKKSLGISKSTLSYWLRDYPLSKQRIRELRDWNEQRIERYRETMRKKKEERLRECYKKQKKLIFPFSSRELFISGLFLYWGEGGKKREAMLGISNTDPAVIKFFIFWCAHSLGVPRNKFRIYLHLYTDMDIDDEINYWSELLKLPRSQFGEPYIKKNSSLRINHKGAFGHGTCNVSIGNARLAERILMSIQAISDKYNK